MKVAPPVGQNKKGFCYVCAFRPATGAVLCDQCRASYDGSLTIDGTEAGVIKWAANRARHFERSRRPRHKPPHADTRPEGSRE